MTNDIRPTYVNPRFNIEPIDGTVYVTDVHHDDGIAYVTIAGCGEQPTIVMFDKDDLDTINAARKELKRGRPSDPDPGAVLDILNAAGVSNQFVYDRVEYRYTDGNWVAQCRVDDTLDEPVCECDEAFCPNFHIEKKVRDRFRKRRIRKAVTG